jgi:flavin reductase (DIM6/NTAB) family NADH-FMN oxidoreductase RutF
MEQVSDFTINVPPPDLVTAVSLSGSLSGREHDKFREAQLTPAPSREVRSPIVRECVLHYECRTVERVDMSAEALVQNVREQFYPHGDFHRIYFGEIVAAYADEDAVQKLSAPGAAASLP